MDVVDICHACFMVTIYEGLRSLSEAAPLVRCDLPTWPRDQTKFEIIGPETKLSNGMLGLA